MASILSAVSTSGQNLNLLPIRRILVSVSDKTGLVELVSALKVSGGADGIEILSTGGTAKKLRESGFAVKDVSEYTQSPEILDGRVKTLHPKIHGGLLGVRDNEKHRSEMLEHGIGDGIDVVIMNLYPFQQTGERSVFSLSLINRASNHCNCRRDLFAVASGADFATCMENIDIGGPSMLRSSAKNHTYVAILTDPSQYGKFIAHVQTNGGQTSLEMRRELAAVAFSTSAAYDASISAYFSNYYAAEGGDGARAQVVTRTYQPKLQLKYGCNPHQKPAALYSTLGGELPFKVLNGTPGYINLLDACYAWQLVAELKKALHPLPAAASFKHCSPAGNLLSLYALFNNCYAS